LIRTCKAKYLCTLLQRSKLFSMKKRSCIRTERIHARVTKKEMEYLKKEFSASIFRKRSEYFRKKLLDKPTVMKYRNLSVDDFVSEMIRLRNELQVIASQWNKTPDLRDSSEKSVQGKQVFQEKLLFLIHEIKERINTFTQTCMRISIPQKISEECSAITSKN
jgi:hypothetical protein